MYLLILIFPLLNSLILIYYDITIISLIIMWFIVIISFIEIIINDLIIRIDLSYWFLNFKYSFLFDNLTILLSNLIFIILNIIIIFSKYYMNNTNLKKFLIYLYLFAFSMLIVVLNNNFMILFLGWEIVGVFSYLLISFWNNNLNNLKSGIKAILYNKIGDIGIILIILYHYYFNNYLLIPFLLGCITKSAQIFFNGWLNSAMAGPTPVSSLLHSSTMVTIGVYILIKYNIISSNYSFIGLLTIIFISFIGLYTNDIKSIIAYSTCSQLGYLTYSQLIGINNYNHLLIHGFFKALLFISCGFIIHKYLNIQDLRKYGFFLYYLPIEYLFILISSFSLIAFPYFSGYYTKEYILLYSYFNYFHNYIFSLIGALLTILYTFRLIYYTFYNRPNQILNNNSSVPYYLIILLFGGLIIGDLLNKDYLDYENLSIYIKLLPFYFLFFSIIIIKYIKLPNIFYFDELYNRFIIFFYNITYNNFKIIEKSIFDYIWLINLI